MVSASDSAAANQAEEVKVIDFAAADEGQQQQ